MNRSWRQSPRQLWRGDPRVHFASEDVERPMAAARVRSLPITLLWQFALADIEIQQDGHDHIDWKVADAGGREAPLARRNDGLLIQSWIE